MVKISRDLYGTFDGKQNTVTSVPATISTLSLNLSTLSPSLQSVITEIKPLCALTLLNSQLTEKALQCRLQINISMAH